MSLSKLRTNLRIIEQRLKLLEKKKTEMSLKSRKEIADLISAGKEDRARIKVECIIRDDYLVEAYELIETFCDLLVARFGLIEMSKNIPEGLETAISTVIWATPRLQTDVNELVEIRNQFIKKYGKPYVMMCQENSNNTVSQQVIHKLSVEAPPRHLVEQYMVEIARSFNVQFEPDPILIRAPNDEMNWVSSPPGWALDTNNLINLNPSSNQSNRSSDIEMNYPPKPMELNSNPNAYFIGGFGGSSANNNMEKPPLPPDEPFHMPSTNQPSLPPKYNDPDYSQPPSGSNSTAPTDDFLNLPSAHNDDPVNQASSSNLPGNDSVDFDELTRRFEQLKKKK